jgi:hypothetical protein
LVLDAWTGNSGKRQVLFVRSDGLPTYDPFFLDHHLNLTLGLSGESTSAVPAYCHREFYDFVRGWGSFEPSLTKVEEVDQGTVANALAYFPDEWEIPEEWRLGVAEHLLQRRANVRPLISGLRYSPTRLFRNWGAPWPPEATYALRAEAHLATSCRLVGGRYYPEEAIVMRAPSWPQNPRIPELAESRFTLTRKGLRILSRRRLEELYWGLFEAHMRKHCNDPDASNCSQEKGAARKR